MVAKLALKQTHSAQHRLYPEDRRWILVGALRHEPRRIHRRRDELPKNPCLRPHPDADRLGAVGVVDSAKLFVVVALGRQRRVLHTLPIDPPALQRLALNYSGPQIALHGSFAAYLSDRLGQPLLQHDQVGGTILLQRGLRTAPCRADFCTLHSRSEPQVPLPQKVAVGVAVEGGTHIDPKVRALPRKPYRQAGVAQRSGLGAEFSLG